MIHTKELLRKIPKVDVLIEAARKAGLYGQYGSVCIRESAQETLAQLRGMLLEGRLNSVPEENELIAEMSRRCEEKTRRSLRPVINATGVILHTNLGRSPLNKKAAEAAYDAAIRYSTVEFDLTTGSRGSRHSHVERLLTMLCGCEAGMVVNNNAAAVLLSLGGLSREREVIVSRGELVEIGGSFRMPDIMELSGGILREVGTTNKTHASDYEKAINENTGALLKVHTSNFVISGFTESVSIREMAAIAHRHSLPAIYDLGSGLLFPMPEIRLGSEPNVQEAIFAGADIVCFSGDKLLGGPQAGIIVGRKAYIDLLKAHPLMRAIRCDKMTLAALEATLRLYFEPDEMLAQISTLRMLGESGEALKTRAQKLCQILSGADGLRLEIVTDNSMAGGGSLPGKEFPTYCVAISKAGVSASSMETILRSARIPIIVRIKNDRCLLDLRTVSEEEVELMAECIAGVF